MNIPAEILATRQIECIDTQVFLQYFDEPAGGTILEIGSHDESSDAASLLSQAGYKVTGVDLREPNHADANKAYAYVRADWCDLPAEFIREHLGRVDSIFSLSAIEHFGLTTYQEGGHPDFLYDCHAIRQAWQLLKPMGALYVTVPFGNDYRINMPHWRVYSHAAFMQYIVQDFTPELFYFFFSADAPGYSKGQVVSMEEAMAYDGWLPHCTILAKLRKVPINRLAPDGR